MACYAKGLFLFLFQCGFRSLYSSSIALLRILSSVDKDKLAALACLNLFRAFHTLDHNVLLDILKHISFGVLTPSLLSGYLESRHQCVALNNRTTSRPVIYVLVYHRDQFLVLFYSMYSK